MERGRLLVLLDNAVSDSDGSVRERRVDALRTELGLLVSFCQNGICRRTRILVIRRQPVAKFGYIVEEMKLILG